MSLTGAFRPRASLLVVAIGCSVRDGAECTRRQLPGWKFKPVGGSERTCIGADISDVPLVDGVLVA
eukprot:9188393-Alexandrium_andersonii.AAC.1